MHPQARSTPVSRAIIVRRVLDGSPVSRVSRDFGVSRQTVYKWLRRFREGGEPALLDRRPVAARFPSRVPFAVELQVQRLRRTRRLLGREIAAALEMPRSTVIKVLKRLKLGRLSALDVPLLVQRYEYAQPGEMVHIDIKKLGRISRVGHRINGDRRTTVDGAGWEHVYVCVDDASRLAYLEVRRREDRFDAAEFLCSAAGWFAQRGIQFARVMTDNGGVFRSGLWRAAMQELGARPVRTRPYCPRTNGKAERFIQSMLRECAYAIAFQNSDERRAALEAWNRHYNEDRPHSALKLRPPASWLARCQQPA
jgi:transposase InsO family protein